MFEVFTPLRFELLFVKNKDSKEEQLIGHTECDLADLIIARGMETELPVLPPSIESYKSSKRFSSFVIGIKEKESNRMKRT